jgi:hypothetical protein
MGCEDSLPDGNGEGGGGYTPPTPNNVTINFYDDGILIDSRQYHSGVYIWLPDQSDRSCSEFNGWRVDGTGALITEDSSYRVETDTDFHTVYTSNYNLEISSATEFNNIRSNPSGCYKLKNNISLSTYGIGYDSGAGWQPIGTNMFPFTGGLDGNGFEITDLYINRPSATYTGLFGYIGENAEIRNLGVEIAAGGITGGEYTGGIAGMMSGNYENEVVIINSYVRGVGNISSTSTSSSYVGGIAGFAYDTNISNSYNTGSISSISTYSSYTGGITGSGSNIFNSYNTGIIDSTSSSVSYAGGIAGSANSVSNSYNTGSVSSVLTSSSYYSTSYAGGIAGSANSISNSYNTGSINASSATSSSDAVYAGGIAGQAGSIISTYNTGLITATSDAANIYAGGIMGYLSGSGSSIKNNAAIGSDITVSTVSGAVKIGRIFADAYYSVTGVTISNNFALSGMTASGGTFNTSETVYHGTDRTEAQLKTATTYSDPIENSGLGWLFGDDNGHPWTMDGSVTGYPILYWQ